MMAVMVPTGSPFLKAMKDWASQKSNAGFTSGDSVLMSSLISGGT